MGRMVSDTEAVVAAAANLDEVDPARIYLLGYSLGAKVGLLAAALDDRVSGVAAVCGVDGLRRSGPEAGIEVRATFGVLFWPPPNPPWPPPPNPP